MKQQPNIELISDSANNSMMNNRSKSDLTRSIVSSPDPSQRNIMTSSKSRNGNGMMVNEGSLSNNLNHVAEIGRQIDKSNSNIGLDFLLGSPGGGSVVSNAMIDESSNDNMRSLVGTILVTVYEQKREIEKLNKKIDILAKSLYKQDS